jgi:hypothetical protein
VFSSINGIIQGTELEVAVRSESHGPACPWIQLCRILGLFQEMPFYVMQLGRSNIICHRNSMEFVSSFRAKTTITSNSIHVSLMSLQFHDESFGILLAIMLAETLHIHELHFYADFSVLAAAEMTNIFPASGH